MKPEGGWKPGDPEYREWLDGDVQEWGVFPIGKSQPIYRSPDFGYACMKCREVNEARIPAHLGYRMPDGWKQWHDEQPIGPGGMNA